MISNSEIFPRDLRHVLDLAKSYADSQRIGYVETTKKVISWDSAKSLDGVPSIDLGTGYVFYKISDLTPTLDELDGGTFVIYDPSKAKTYEYLIAQDNGRLGCEGEEIYIMLDGDLPIVIVDPVCATVPEPGTWFYVSSLIEASDWGITIRGIATTVIHPIDPKFTTKTIRLADYGIDLASLVLAGGGKYTVDDVGNFWADVNTDMPLALITDFGDMRLKTVGGVTLARNAAGTVVELASSVSVLYNGNIIQTNYALTKQGNSCNITVVVG